MRASLSRLLVRTGVVVSALLAVSTYGAPVTPTVGGGLIGTSHDFTTVTGDNMVGAPSTPIGLCTYCHTPHKAQSTLLLWNHTLSGNTFKWDVPSTTAGTTYPTIAGGSYKGPTVKCLSCHDGSVAVGDVGWFKAQAWNGTGTPATAPLTAFKLGSNGDKTNVVGSAGGMAGNHPVAMPYPWANTLNTYNSQTNGSMLQTAEWVGDPTTNTAAKIRLFNDDGTGVISAGPIATKTGIECSSCHDPHNKSAVDDYFLRGKVAGSQISDGYLCVQCHKK